MRAQRAATLSGRVSTEKLICYWRFNRRNGGDQRGADSHARRFTGHRDHTAHAAWLYDRALRRRLNGLCQITVQEAVNGSADPARACLHCPGRQTVLDRAAVELTTCALCKTAEPVNRHKPSVEVLFKSAAAGVWGRNAYGIMLTGMGSDGAKAMKEMRDAGSYNYVQDEATCVVFGMPREAILHGAADEVLASDCASPRRF